MIIIEIVLTLFSWRRGWRGWSLIPLGAAIVLGLMTGSLWFSSAPYPDISGQASGFYINGDGITIFDLLATGVLVFMLIKRRRKITLATQASQSALEIASGPSANYRIADFSSSAEAGNISDPQKYSDEPWEAQR